jgi:acyl-CoA hydrolase
LEPKTFTIHHLVKAEDLNHHRRLFAGRGAELVVEAGFISAASLLPPANVVCVKIHGMHFKRPVQPGPIVCFQSKVIFTGRSRLVSYVSATVNEALVVDSFLTFVYVDEDGKPQPHHITIEPVTEQDQDLDSQAQLLK